ncbi:MAG: hypothetical protein JNK75_04315 [Betaproteobacteria bacterium]|nr:hypothetical protein [Betaproteobacteria bacterium]
MNLHMFRKAMAFVASAALSAMALAPTSAAAQAATLDGKVFVADAGIKGQAADEKDDILSFKDGKFHSSSCDQWGYGKGDYKAMQAGDTISFETETFSEKYGRLAWKGVVRGDTIEGTFIQYPKPGFFSRNPAPIEHWFKGRLKP